MTYNNNIPSGFQFFRIEEPTLVHVELKHCIISNASSYQSHLPNTVVIAFDIYIPLARKNCHTILMVEIAQEEFILRVRCVGPLPEIPLSVFSIVVGREWPLLYVN